MTDILRWWRDLSKDQKQQFKKEHNVKVVTYQFIKKLYLEVK